jgi:hypothetical protein
MNVFRTQEELEAGLDDIRNAPPDKGTLDMIVRRPAVDEREVVEVAELHPDHGLVGDSWGDRLPEQYLGTQEAIDRQLTVMNSRFAALIAGDEARWPLAGDQLYVDLDLSEANTPAGTRLAIGEAVIEVSQPPHTGCQKFSSRFGLDALKFANSEVGSAMHLRGVNARVVVPGTIRRGDSVLKTAKSAPVAQR